MIEFTLIEKQLLELSHEDYKAGRYISQEQLDIEDKEWEQK